MSLEGHTYATSYARSIDRNRPDGSDPAHGADAAACDRRRHAEGRTCDTGTRDEVGTDPNGRASMEWGVYGVPETFIVGRDGRIAYKLVGPITEANLERVIRPEIEKALAK